MQAPPLCCSAPPGSVYEGVGGSAALSHRPPLPGSLHRWAAAPDSRLQLADGHFPFQGESQNYRCINVYSGWKPAPRPNGVAFQAGSGQIQPPILGTSLAAIFGQGDQSFTRRPHTKKSGFIWRIQDVLPTAYKSLCFLDSRVRHKMQRLQWALLVRRYSRLGHQPQIRDTHIVLAAVQYNAGL